jgi:rhamnose transport system substrate-binding protein
MKSLRVVLAALALVAALLVAACGETQEEQQASGGQAASSGNGEANPNAPIKEGLKTVSIPKQLGNPYEEIEHSGVDEALKELGGSNRSNGPTDASASSQVSIIKLRRTAVAGRDPHRGRGSGEFAVLSATANATNQNTWIKFMREELKKSQYADLKLVKVAYGDDDDQKSFQETQGLIQAYPNLKAIVAPTTVGISAAARYLSSSPKKGDVKVTGLGTPNQMRKFVKDGTVDEFALWVPKDVGYLAGYAAAALASGRITGAQGEKFEAGRLGEKTIGANGEIVLGPPTRFNKDNIDDFDF